MLYHTNSKFRAYQEEPICFIKPKPRHMRGYFITIKKRGEHIYKKEIENTMKLEMIPQNQEERKAKNDLNIKNVKKHNKRNKHNKHNKHHTSSKTLNPKKTIRKENIKKVEKNEQKSDFEELCKFYNVIRVDLSKYMKEGVNPRIQHAKHNFTW
ncbi:hypothetical protein BDAP_000218 [Binucleata daphniae]